MKRIEILKKHFSHCFNKSGEFDFDKFKAELSESELNFYKESYSLDWLGKSYARILATDEPKTFLKEDRDFNQKGENRNSENILIKGDNLEVLKHLSNAYWEKIKMIYIDPPYNTGNDGFVYNDSRNFTVEELAKLADIDIKKAKRILDFVNSKSNSLSAWLTFMYPRLYIARGLLKEDGVIFISIDDNEVAQLRLLCDEIFGEENFVIDLIRKTKSTTNDTKTGTNIQHENCLVYAKHIDNTLLLGQDKNLSNYKNPDNDPNGTWVSSDPSAKSGTYENNYFEIINPYTGKIDLPPKGMFWRFSKNTIQKHINNGKIVFKKEHKKNERGFIFKRYKNELKTTKEFLGSLDFANNLYMNQTATKELLKLDLAEYFKYPKPIKFISKIVLHSTDKNDIILDFFAGSGTTGDAVMQLNSEDGGDRKYILLQLDEPIDPKKNRTAYEFVKDELGVENPTIFEITKERLIRASKRVKENNLLNQNLDLGFKIFETTPIWENYNFEAEKLESTLELFDEDKLNEEDLKTLLITWKTYDGVVLTKDLEEIDFDGYRGYYTDGKLYFVDRGFNSDNLKELLEKIDIDRDFNPNLIVAFGYHFDSKNLREIGENIKSYSNKKNSDIDFVIRY